LSDPAHRQFVGVCQVQRNAINVNDHSDPSVPWDRVAAGCSQAPSLRHNYLVGWWL
jgi:hypothetical protein